ncbi:hypothetical protein [Lysinibacillus telephonicus]|nr:hypothetical protein [Lysinibacillus telephonicus]
MNTNINNINTNVGTVKTDVASIKNTVTSGFKPAVMTPFSYVITKGSGSYTIDTWYTLINITGEGELQNVLSAVGHGNGSNMLRVTIDGVVKYYGKTPESYNGPGGVIGMTKLDNIFNRPDYGEPFMGLSATNDFNLGSVVTYPYTGGGGGVSLIDIPIRFKSSLKIEWMPQVRTTDTHYVFATGGVF